MSNHPNTSLKMKSYKTLLFTLSFLSIITFSACDPEDSADVNQDRIYTSYELVYNSNTDITTAIARINFGGILGTPLELSDPAFVTFNDQVLSYSTLDLGHKRDFAGRIDGGTFRYTNTEGTLYENEVTALNNLAFPSSFTQVSRSQAANLEWVGPALTSGQSITVTIESNGISEIFTREGNGASNIVLGSGQLSNLSTGSGTASIDKFDLSSLQEGTSAGGQIIHRLIAADKQISITN